MPTFYSVGGAMLSPEQIANRRAADNGEDLVFSSKSDLVKRIVELSSAAGKNVTQSQQKRYEEMRRDQLDVLIANLSRKPIVKKDKEAEVVEPVKEVVEPVAEPVEEVKPAVSKPSKK